MVLLEALGAVDFMTNQSRCKLDRPPNGRCLSADKESEYAIFPTCSVSAGTLRPLGKRTT